MAPKKSLWSELQRERERRQRVTQAQERMNEQTVRQLMRDHDRAERQAARAEAAERKRQERFAHEAGAVRSAKRVLNELSLAGADAIRADARRFHQLVDAGAAQVRTAALFAQGLQPVARSNSTSATAPRPVGHRVVQRSRCSNRH
jgi:hypothetical protein